jgi:hypothetical protein
VQHFDGYAAVEQAMLALVHHAHATAADDFEDFIFFGEERTDQIVVLDQLQDRAVAGALDQFAGKLSIATNAELPRYAAVDLLAQHWWTPNYTLGYAQ